ncbi:MAG: phosphotransferase [Micropepsaceae bacterium]
MRHIPALGDCDQVKITGPVHTSPYTRLFLGQLPLRAEKILIKCCYQTNSDVPDVAYAQLLFDSLVDLNKARGSETEFNLIQPFHLFRDRGIIVQSWIEGQSLARAFADMALPIQRQRELLSEAGKWLGHFHRFGRTAERTRVRPELFDDVERDAGALGKSGRRLVTVIRRLRASRAFDGSLQQSTAQLHCDFKPSNLIATETGIFAIDFHRSNPASVYFDIAHLLNSMELDIIKARRPLLFLRTSLLKKDFLSAYSKIGGHVDPLILAIYQIYDLARYMTQHGEAETSNLRGTFRRIVLERLLRSRLAQFHALERRHGAAPGPV